jgi:putative ABC transport system substrate-binding protein
MVFTGGSDPVKLGLVASLGRPGGNATGVTTNSLDLIEKRLQLLREMVPSATKIAVLFDFMSSPNDDEDVKQFQATACARGQGIQIVSARSERDFKAAFAQSFRSVQIFRSCSQPRLHSRLVQRSQRCSVSRFRRPCFCVPTR